MRHGKAVWFLLLAVLSPAFAAGDSPSPPGTAKVTPQTAAALHRMLDVGFAAGRDKVAAAQTLWRRIGAADRHDPRVDFALGLVLQKHRRTRDAERQFQSAAAQAGPAYLPAAEAGIWIQLARKQYAPGLKTLRKLIEAAADAKQPQAAGRLQAAEWTGRVIAALQEIPLPDRTQADVDRLGALAETSFRKAALAAAYEKGRQAVKSLAGELSVEAVKTRVLAGKKLAKEEKQTRKEIASRKGDVDKSQESLKLTAEQWKDWLDDQTKRTKRTLTRAVKEMAILNSRRTSISRSILLTTRQKTGILARMQFSARGGRQAAAIRNQGANAALARIEQTLLRYNLQQSRTTQQMNAVRQTATAALKQYRTAVKRFQHATGSIAKKNTALAKIESQLQQQERKLQRTSVKQTTAVKQMKVRQASFTTYVKFDVDAEKKRLLESLKN